MQVGRQFSRKRFGWGSREVVIDQLNTYLGGIRNNDVYLGITGAVQDFFPLIARRKRAANGRIDERFLDGFSSLQAPDAVGEQIVPVSYTHLDVYKRQMVPTVRRR